MNDQGKHLMRSKGISHFLRKLTGFPVNDIFKWHFVLLTAYFTQELIPEPIKVTETTHWALKQAIISFYKACPVFFYLTEA